MNQDGCDWMGYGQKSASDFDQSIIYETDGLFVDNRAMAGRNSRSYFDEGRLDDLKKAIKSGDYLFIQFTVMQTRKRSVMLRQSSMRNICFAMSMQQRSARTASSCDSNHRNEDCR